MLGKRQKLTAKRGRASENPTPNFDLTKFFNEGVVDRFGTICKNWSFIKEKGFHHHEDFFRKTIGNKGWQALCQTPHPAATSLVREFYANLASHVIKKVRVRGVLVDYPEVLQVLTNGRGEWKLNSEGHAVHFKAKHLAYIPKV